MRASERACGAVATHERVVFIMGFDIKQLFGLAPSAEERTKSCRARIRKLKREIDQQIRDVERASKATEREIKSCAKRNDVASARALAKEIVQARATVSKLYTSKAQASSVENALAHRVATQTSARSIELSAEVLKHMNALVKTAAVREEAMELSREMMKAGVMAELLDDALDVANDEIDEEETNRAIEDVLREIAGEVVLPAAAKDVATAPEVVAEDAEAAEATPASAADAERSASTHALKARLDAMRVGEETA